MNFHVLDCPQRSDEWFAARAGRVTSSNCAAMLATIQKGEAAARRNLRVRLALERVTQKTLDRSEFQSQAMLDGIEREADALSHYEALTGQVVERTGFLQHQELLTGASLDGHVGNFTGVVEAKCPEHSAHLDYLTTGEVPAKYRHQITHQLWLTGAQWADFLSYQPDFPERLQVKLVRIARNESDIAAYELVLRQFLRQVDELTTKIQSLENEQVAV